MLGELKIVQVVLNDLPEQVGGAAGDIPSLQGNISRHDNQVLKSPGVNAPIDPHNSLATLISYPSKELSMVSMVTKK